jgi:hypothetical protein
MVPRKMNEVLSAGLFFDDGVDSFIVIFLFYPRPSRVNIQERSQNNAESDLNGLPNSSLGFDFIRGRSDRATCTLSSERVVSASFRPEHWRGDPCYALRVSVSNPSP